MHRSYKAAIVGSSPTWPTNRKIMSIGKGRLKAKRLKYETVTADDLNFMFTCPECKAVVLMKDIDAHQYFHSDYEKLAESIWRLETE